MIDEVPLELNIAADAYRKTLIPRADGFANGWAPLWHGWAVFDAYVAGHRAALASLRSPPAPANDALSEFYSEADKQTYDENKRGNWDLPDDYEYSLTISAGMLRGVMRAIEALRSPPAPASELVEPVAWITKAGLEEWMKGADAEAHILMRRDGEPGHMERVPLYSALALSSQAQEIERLTRERDDANYRYTQNVNEPGFIRDELRESLHRVRDLFHAEKSARLSAEKERDALRGALRSLVDWLDDNQRNIEGEFSMAELLAPARAALTTEGR